MEQSLQAFINGFKHCEISQHLSIHSCFAPALLGFAVSATTLRHSRGRSPNSGLRNYSRSALSSKYDNDVRRNQYASSSPVSRVSSRKDGVNLRNKKARREQRTERERLKQLISTYLDPFIPHTLRAERTSIGKLGSFSEALLEAKRQANGVNLLHFMAVEQRRPIPLIEFSRHLLRMKPKTETSGFYDLISTSALLEHRKDLALEELTTYDVERQAFVIGDVETRDAQTLQSTTDSIYKIDNEVTENEHLREVLGYLWEALGLAVVDLPDSEPNKRDTTGAFVYQLLALMHSRDAIPLLTYEFDSAAVSIELRKPPYLHAMRSRIMAFLSDSMLQPQQIGAVGSSTSSAMDQHSNPQEGLEASYMPPAPPLGNQTWLELILWACLHGHHFREAARIISYAVLESDGPGWSMVGWHDVNKQTAGRADKAPSDRESQSWLARMSGFSGVYSEATSVEMPRYVLSREVVLRTLHGVALLDPQEDLELQRSAIQAFILMAESSPHFSFDVSFNSAIARLMDAGPSLCKLFSQSSMVKRSPSHSDNKEIDLSLAAAENSILTRYNFLHFGFMKTVESSDVKESLKLLERMHHMIDLHEKELSTDITGSDIGRSHTASSKPRMSVPDSTVALLIEQLTRAGHWATLEKLVDSAGSEGSILPENAIEMPCFQPSLLRYASAAPNWKLFSKVIQTMTTQEGSFPTNALQALLEAQISMHKFFQARKLLAGAARERLLVLGAKEIAIMAREFMRLSKSNDTKTLSNAKLLLEGVFGRGFVPTRDPSKPMDYVPLRILNQMIRILGTIEGPMGELANTHVIHSGPGISDIDIDVEAFNILLNTVKVLQSREDAEKLFRRWVKPIFDSNVAPLAASPRETDYLEDYVPFRPTGANSDYGEVVEPNAETLRIVFDEPKPEPIDDEDDFGVEADAQSEADLEDGTLEPYIGCDVEDGIMKQPM